MPENYTSQGGALKKSPFVLFWFLVAALATTPACDAKEPPNTTISAKQSLYPILDSGVWADEGSRNTYWLDNDRILFRGSVATEKAGQKRKENYRLAIWEIGKKVTTYTTNILGDLCYSNGIVSYSKPGHILMHGELGNEKPIQLDPTKKYHNDDMNCRMSEVDQLLAQRKNRAINPLLDRHGYLDLGLMRAKEIPMDAPVLFYQVNEANPITLPLRRKDAAGLHYYAFKDAYYISFLGAYARIGKKPATTWWLYPDGRVEEVQIPIGPWATGISTQAFPTRVGMFMVSHAYKSTKDPGPAGGYFVQGDKWLKVLDGSIHGTAVSKDGCKVAFSHAPNNEADNASSNDPARRTLKLINFCMEEKRHAK